MKILIIGAHPLPYEKGDRLFALGLRTWHFTKPLLDDGHQVYLFTAPIPPTEAKIEKVEDISTQGNLTHHKVEDIKLYLDKSYLQKIHDKFQPDCIVGVNTFPASVASGIKTDKPRWLDLNGALMTEAQAKSYVILNNRPVSDFWEQEKACLWNGDIYSTVSIAQKYMLLGELATFKRLNQYTTGYEFAYPIPNSVEHCNYSHQKNVLRVVHVDEKDFIILWSGGYNTWTDVDFLFDALNSVLSKYPQVKFVSTGGNIPKHDEFTYRKFLEKIQLSAFSKRFLILGWVPSADIHDYYFESNLGISLDTNNYETLTGARNRLIHMMKIGLPVLTTIGTEISEVIRDNQIGLTSAIGDHPKFLEQLEFAITHPEELKQLGHKGKKFIADNYTFEKTTQPLREWVKHPALSPDKKHRSKEQPIASSPSKNESPMELAVNWWKKAIKR